MWSEASSCFFHQCTGDSLLDLNVQTFSNSVDFEHEDQPQPSVGINTGRTTHFLNGTLKLQTHTSQLCLHQHI